MDNQELPTDEEYLEEFFEIPSGHSNQLLDNPVLLAEIVQDLVKGGVVPPGEDPEKFAISLFDPRTAFRGFKTEILINAAKKTLPEDLHYLLKIPIGFLFLEDLNGFAAPTPRGNSIIVLNSGVNLHLHLLAKCIVTLSDWKNARPFCGDRQPADFFYAIICLARFACTDDYENLRAIKIWRYPDSETYTIQAAKLAAVAEEFVLLHEYGHVAGGHTNPSKLTTTKLGFTIYAQDHVQEYEADHFAFKHLQAGYGRDGSALAVTTVFRFLDLVEHLLHGRSKSSQRHPAAMERLNALKAAFDLVDEKKETFGEIESMFDLALNARHSAVNRTSRTFL